MNVKTTAELLELTIRSGAGNLDREVTGGYVSDMLSDVIANSRAGSLWITMQVHQNIVAVATLKDLAGIVVIGGKMPSEDTVEKAKTEGVNLMTSQMTAFEAAGKLFLALQDE